jgi:alpha-tubulin suppressor-like RCC1 family protein
MANSATLDNSHLQTDVPTGLSNVVAITAGTAHSLALKKDGTIVGWGINAEGKTQAPAGLSNVVAVAAGGEHSVALKSDGNYLYHFNGGRGLGRHALICCHVNPFST